MAINDNSYHANGHKVIHRTSRKDAEAQLVDLNVAGVDTLTVHVFGVIAESRSSTAENPTDPDATRSFLVKRTDGGDVVIAPDISATQISVMNVTGGDTMSVTDSINDVDV